MTTPLRLTDDARFVGDVNVGRDSPLELAGHTLGCRRIDVGHDD
jgi:hypothetical protein